ncbi:hypothetical protein EV426DRAFT_643897, partial [Tirmania nivea]
MSINPSIIAETLRPEAVHRPQGRKRSITSAPTPRARQNPWEDKESEEREAGERRHKHGNDEVLERLQRLEEIVRQHVTTGQDQWENDNERGRASSSNREPRTSVAQGPGPAVAEVHSGKLLVQAGRTRYVSPLFWGVITEEIQDLSSLVLDDSRAPTHASSPALSTLTHPSPDYLTTQPTITFDDDHLFSLTFPSTSICASTSIHQYLPHRQQAEFLLLVFKQRVDPLLRLLHLPSFIIAFRIYYDGLDSINGQLNFQDFDSSANVYLGSSESSFEALLFAVFYAAVNSLTEEEVVKHVNLSASGARLGGGCRTSAAWKPRMLAECKRATEISLLKAKFLEQGDLVTVMAFAILLICLCHEADVPSLYPLTGLLIRIAQSLGLHRDPALLFSPRKPSSSHSPTSSSIPTTNGITPLEAELRRRLWHHICHLDLRVCEAHGPDPGILLEEKMWPLGPATRFPGCINDEDISDSTSITDLGLPAQDPGRFTRMTMQLVRFNASLCVRRIMNPAATPGVRIRAQARKYAEAEGGRGGEWDEEEELRREVKEDLDAMLERNENFYLRYCDDDTINTNSARGGSGGSVGNDNDDDIPALKKMTKAAGRMVEAKLRMMYYHRFIKNKKSSPDHESWELRKSIITKSLHLLHHRTTLLSDPTLAPYHWHIKVHKYFHTAFHILSELCTPEFLGGGEDILELRAKAWEVIGGMDWNCSADEDG